MGRSYLNDLPVQISQAQSGSLGCPHNDGILCSLMAKHYVVIMAMVLHCLLHKAGGETFERFL